MKKLLVLIAFIAFTITTSYAQEISKNAIGTRVFSSTGVIGSFSSDFLSYNISYQRKLKENTRLEVNTVFTDDFNHFYVNGLYEWVWNLKNNFNWYAGAGLTTVPTFDFALSASGIVGIEYDLKIPLLISLDYMPQYGITNNTTQDLTDGFNLSVRYQF